MSRRVARPSPVGAGPAGGRAGGARADVRRPSRWVWHVRFRPGGEGSRLGAAEVTEDAYQRLLAVLAEFSPVIEALPPGAATVDVSGSLRYFGRDAVALARVARVRALARHGVDCAIGVAGNPSLARMAAHDGDPGRTGGVHVVPTDAAGLADYLARKPAVALPGVGQATARTLCGYGLDSVARIAAAPPGTLQRILGAAAGRALHERAHGIDPTPVTPNAPARSVGAEHRFPHDELDSSRRRRALLSLADQLGARLRREGQVARSLTLTVRYADRSATARTRTLAEPTAHTPALTDAAYAAHDALALERARVRSVALRAEGLTSVEYAAHQLTFDVGDDRARRIEAVTDRLRARFGDRAARPAGFLDVA